MLFWIRFAGRSGYPKDQGLLGEVPANLCGVDLGGGKNSVVLVLSSNRIWRYDRYKKDAEGVIE